MADRGSGMTGQSWASGHVRTPARVRWLAAGAAFAIHAAAVLAAMAGVWETVPPPVRSAASLVTFDVAPTRPAAPPPREKPADAPAVRQLPPRPAPAREGKEPVAKSLPAVPPARPAAAALQPSAATLPAPVTNAPSPEDALAAYKAVLWQRIADNRPRGVHGAGSVLLRFRLDRNGALAAADVARSCGNILIDRQALRALKAAAPFPAPPAGLAEAQLAFTVPMNFR